MASAMLLGGCWLLLQISWTVAQQNCPTVESIFPPSGTVDSMYLLTGNNLDRLSQIEVDLPGTEPVVIEVAEVMHNVTHVQFTIGGTLLRDGLRDIIFTASVAECQSQLQPIQLDLRMGKY